MSLKARLDALARRAPPAGRVIVVQPSSLDGELDGDPIERTPGGYLLRVPFEADDPMAALTEGQRALIGPDDRVITIRYVKDWRGAPGA